ncbi:MAG: glycosyltransferase family 9 protein [Candidatus Zixiibacteriota bacterium]
MGLDPKNATGRFLKNIEIYFKWMVLVWFVALGGVRRKRGKFDPRKLRRVLFVRHDKLGDMIISLPIFHNLKRFFPNIEIDVLCGRDNNMIIEHDPHISKTLFYRKKPLADMKRIMEMRRRKYDAIVDMTFGESVTATILLSLIGPGAFKLGAGKSRLAGFFDLTVDQDVRHAPHIIESTATLLNLFGIRLDDCNLVPKMYLIDEDERKGRSFLEPIKSNHDTVIGINLSAGRPARTWPVEKYVELIGMLYSRFENAGFVLTAAPGERWKIEKVMSVHTKKIYPIPEGFSIREIAGLLKHLDYLITPDTSIGHIASCVNLPTLAIYPGNMDNFAVWRPFNPCVRAINSPDFYRVEYLDVEPVFEAFCSLVAEEKSEAMS